MNERANRIVGARGWDSFLPVAIGGLLLFLRPQLAGQWNQQYTPSPTCLHVIDVGEAALRGILTWEGLIVTIVIAGFIYLTLTGQAKILRSIKIAAFFGAAIDVALGIHLPMGHVSGWSAGFEHAMDQTFVVCGSVLIGVPIAIYCLLALINRMSGHGGPYTNIAVGFLGIFAWVELIMASIMLGWKDLLGIGVIGALANTGEVVVTYKDNIHIGVSSIESWIVMAILMVVYAFTAIACYTAFIAAWAPNLFC